MARSGKVEVIDQASVDELLQSHTTELISEHLKMENDTHDEGKEP